VQIQAPGGQALALSSRVQKFRDLKVEAGFADAIKRAPTGENQGETQAKREMGVFSLDSPGD